MLLIDIHKFDIVFAHAIRSVVLKDQVNDIRCVFSLYGEDIVALCRSQNFSERAEIDSKRDVAVTTEGLESFGTQQHGDEGDMGTVHGLQGDSRIVAIKVAVLHQVLDSIDHLVQC